MISFEEAYKEVVESIDGDNENMVSYDSQSRLWEIQAVNNTMCALGEVSGEIIVESPNLDALLIAFRMAVIDYNMKKRIRKL